VIGIFSEIPSGAREPYNDEELLGLDVVMVVGVEFEREMEKEEGSLTRNSAFGISEKGWGIGVPRIV
jgi:hypothetical protein